MSQEIIYTNNLSKSIFDALTCIYGKKVLVVGGRTVERLAIQGELETLGVSIERFSGFSANPKYEDICDGVEVFRSLKCDCILAIGGGSAIDVAKCIKLFATMPKGEVYLEREYEDTDIPLIAVPTTAGTGSESTRFAVCYYKGKKQSVTHQSLIPDYAILDYKLLESLPIYQKKCTMLDALCQGIESWWSVNSNVESKAYSKKAVELIAEFGTEYIEKGSDTAAEKIMLASNYSGRAINITQTTAAHAMSYKLTSLYALPHGHAAALCLPMVWEYMVLNMDKCKDTRGAEYLKGIFLDISKVLGENSIQGGIGKFNDLLTRFEMSKPISKNKNADVSILTNSVNLTRLANNPVTMDKEVIKRIYEMVVEDEK